MAFPRCGRSTGLLMAAVLTCGPMARAEPVAHAAAAPAPEQADLCERLIEMAVQLQQTSPAAAAALADAADRMMPADPRLLREAVDLRLSLGQRDPAIKLLGQLRQLVPTDQLALVQSIDLLSSQQQSADQSAAFLQKMVDNANLAAEVRSHAAVLLAGVQNQRGLDADVEQAITAAIRLNPVNTRALQWRLDQQMRSGTAVRRAHALVELLLANPLQPPVLSRLAEEHARAGAMPESAKLYAVLFDQLQAMESAASADDVINYAGVLLQTGRANDAAAFLKPLVKDNPYDAQAQLLSVLVAQQSGDAAATDSQIATARAGIIRWLMTLQQKADSSAPKADGVASPSLPDLTAAVEKIKAANLPNLSAAYAVALGDLAWLDVYFRGAASPKPVTDALHNLGEAGAVVADRIGGFTALAAGQFDSARQKFTAAGDHDPLSELGVLCVRLKQGEDKAAVLSDGVKLLQKYPVGLNAQLIRQSLHAAGSVEFRSPDADAILAEANRLPTRWLSFAQSGSENYLLKVDPLSPNVTVGDPVLVNITLQNVGQRPLVIGPGGVIDQYVPLDVSVRGLQEQAFPGAGVARLTQSLVLQPGGSIKTVARVDNPSVEGYLAWGAQYDASLFVSAILNPATRGNALVPGVGGMRGQAASVVDRAPIHFEKQDVRDKLTQTLAGDDAVARLKAVKQVSAAAAQLATQTDAAGRDLATSATALLHKTADGDASPTVRAVARQQIALQLKDADQAKAVQAMLGSPDFESKLLGCLLTINRSSADRRAWLTPLIKADEPILQRLATALMQLPDGNAPAASQPARSK